jgi:hypothetical protein
MTGGVDGVASSKTLFAHCAQKNEVDAREEQEEREEDSEYHSGHDAGGGFAVGAA